MRLLKDAIRKGLPDIPDRYASVAAETIEIVGTRT
jgi:hypothetical protein